MKTERLPYVPFYHLYAGGVEMFMSDKKYYAEQSEDGYLVVHWNSGKLVCDRATFLCVENVQVMLETTYGKR